MTNWLLRGMCARRRGEDISHARLYALRQVRALRGCRLAAWWSGWSGARRSSCLVAWQRRGRPRVRIYLQRLIRLRLRI